MTSPAPTGLTAVEQVIYDIAVAEHVDPRLALADAQVESGLSPTAVGDQGTSFGLFQLHRGGELGNLTPTQAFNPSTNATVALSVFGAVSAAHPGADPGLIAALSERPANPTAYAQAVDAVYSSSSFLPEVPGGTTATLTAKFGPGGIGALGAGPFGTGPLAPGGAGQGSPVSTILGGLSSSIAKDIFKVALNIALVLGALGLILLGLSRLFPGVTRTVTSALPLAAMAA